MHYHQWVSLWSASFEPAFQPRLYFEPLLPGGKKVLTFWSQISLANPEIQQLILSCLAWKEACLELSTCSGRQVVLNICSYCTSECQEKLDLFVPYLHISLKKKNNPNATTMYLVPPSP